MLRELDRVHLLFFSKWNHLKNLFCIPSDYHSLTLKHVRNKSRCFVSFYPAYFIRFSLFRFSSGYRKQPAQSWTIGDKNVVKPASVPSPVKQTQTPTHQVTDCSQRFYPFSPREHSCGEIQSLSRVSCCLFFLSPQRSLRCQIGSRSLRNESSIFQLCAKTAA